MKFGTLLSNPPYNADNSIVPIYQHFVDRFSSSSNKQTWIIPASFLGAGRWAVGKKLKQTLVKTGVYEIKTNPRETFVARVNTVTVYCDGLPHDTIRYCSDEDHIMIDTTVFLSSAVYNTFDERLWDFVIRMQKKKCFVGSKFDSFTDTIKIGTYDINRDMAKNKFGNISLKDQEWNHGNAHKFMRLWEGTDIEEANRVLPFIESFWYSDIIQLLLKCTKTSYGWGPKHFDDIPFAPYDRVWDDQQLFNYFDLSDDDRSLINEYHGKINDVE